jgi:hypothetical protein
MSILDGNKQSLLVHESPLLGESLLDRGWRQGGLFNATSACFTWNALSDSGADEPITQQHRKTNSGEKFVIITQDCDISALEQQEPYVEALLCKTYKNREFLSKIGRNSTRWFVINFNTGIVAESKYRLQFAKHVLSTLIPEPWPDSPQRLEQFIHWLARRYDRQAIPDAIVKAFQKPVEDVLIRLDKELSDVGVTFTRAVHEVRINTLASTEPPFGLQLVLLVRSDGLNEQEIGAISLFNEAVKNSVDQKIIYLNPVVRVLTEEEISMAEYYATRPLFLEYHTYKGEEIDGMEPYGRV